MGTGGAGLVERHMAYGRAYIILYVSVAGYEIRFPYGVFNAKHEPILTKSNPARNPSSSW
jgi:hypothetical protein